MELKETIDMMNSAEYKERFKAEYYQLVIRKEKLEAMLELNYWTAVMIYMFAFFLGWFFGKTA